MLSARLEIRSQDLSSVVLTTKSKPTHPPQNLTSYRRYINVGKTTSNISNISNSSFYAILDLCLNNIADVDGCKPTSKQLWIFLRRYLTPYRRYINVGEIISNMSTNSHFYTLLDLCWINIADVDRYKPTSKQR